MQVVAHRTQFGRPVLDLAGDLQEPDVGPDALTVTIDEQTGQPLAASWDGGRARSSTIAFTVTPVSGATSGDFQLSKAAAAAPARVQACR